MKKNQWYTVAEYYGEYAQLIKTIEELSELEEVFLRHDLDGIVEECADVLAMIDQIMFLSDYYPDKIMYQVYEKTVHINELPVLLSGTISMIAKSLNDDNRNLNEEICDSLLKVRFLIEKWATENKKKAVIGRRKSTKLRRQLARIRAEEGMDEST